MSTPTPRTDAFVSHMAEQFRDSEWEEFARDFERELAAAKAECWRLRESSPHALDALSAELTRLRAEVERYRVAGTCEIAAMNSNVADYCKRWEARAEKAEAALVELHASFAGNVHAERNQLRDRLAAAQQREATAIASWDEERKRALREGERVVEWRDRAERAEAELAALHAYTTALEDLMDGVGLDLARKQAARNTTP